MRNVIHCMVCLLLLLCLPSHQASAQTFNAQEYRLDNGMQIIVIPNNRAPVITHMVWYKAGAADEPLGISGIAHFMEHLMFKGSGNEEFGIIGPSEFSRRIKSLGGNDNAFTSWDYTAYFQSVAREHLETVMRMEAGRMVTFIPAEDEILSERDVILEERRQRTDNNPSAQLFETLNAALFVNHPYGDPVIGWAHEMAELSRADAVMWHEKFYAPNNAVLIVAGDVTGDEVLQMARNIYGTIPAREIIQRQRTRVPPLVGNSLIVHQDERVREPELYRLYRAPGYHTNKKEALAMDVLKEILGQGPTSRLYKSLVIDQQIATNVGVSYNGPALDETDFLFFATPRPDIKPKDLERAIMAEVNAIIADGVTEDEVSEAIQRLQDSAILARDSLSGPAMIIGRALTTGSSLNDIENWPNEIAEVTAADVQRVTTQYLSPDNRYVSGHLLPKEITKTQGDTE